MKFVLFTLFSSMEYVATFILMFTLFRFRFKGYRKQIALTSLILCYVSYTMRFDGMANITTIVQLILFFLLIWMLFQVQVFYAAIMSFTAFIGYGIVQILIVLITLNLGMLEIADLRENTLKGYVIQLGTAVIYASIGWIIRKKNWGFSFVPTSNYGRIKYTQLNMIFMLVMIISTIAMLFTIYAINNNRSIEASVILLAIFVIIFSVMLYLSNRKDWDNG
jgi:hypothetical protein